MTDHQPSIQFEEEIRQAVAAPAPEAAFVSQLRSQLAKEAAQMEPKTQRFPPRLAWGLAAVLAIVLITLLAFSPTIVEAMKRAFGYVPGAGIVEQNVPLRVLAVPVTAEREGITLTVSQALISPDKTVITYQAENIPEAALARGFVEGETPTPTCTLNDSLRLPDGTLLLPIAGQGSGWGLGYEYRLTFEPLPDDVNQATLLVACLMEAAPGLAPENWEIPLTFIPAPPDLTVVPLIEISPVPPTETEPVNTPAPDEISAPPDATENITPAPQPLTIESYIEMEDGYILIGSFHSITTTEGLLTAPYAPGGIRIRDANGSDVPFDYAADIDLPDGDEHTSSWAYKIQGKYPAWPLSIILETLDVPLNGVQATPLEFDTGPNPQAGQVWTINQDLQVSGYNLRLLTVTRTADGYTFSFQADPAVEAVSVAIQNQGEPIFPMGGGGGGGGDGSLSSSVAYGGQVPEGLLTLEIKDAVLLVPGPWSLQWTPENPPTGEPPAVIEQQPCLTDEVWAQVKANVPAALPEGLEGKFIIFGPNPDQSLWGVNVLNLTDSSREFLAEGSWPIASPNGSKVIFTGNEGLAIHNFSSGETLTLPNTITEDYRMIWSPDSSRIAFVRSSTNQIMVINADGSGQQAVIDNSAIFHNLIGWADNEQLYITEPGPEGVNIQTLRLADGTTHNLFPISSNKADLVLSPDGQWLTFTNSLGGMLGNGLYVARPNGSAQQFVSALDGRALYFPVWSPDNRWLIVSIPDLNDLSAPATQALIELATCQVIPLPDLGGEIYSWGR